MKRAYFSSIRVLGPVIVGATLWACTGNDSGGDEGDDGSGGDGGSGPGGGGSATGGASGGDGGTRTGGQGGGSGTAGSAGSGGGGRGGASGAAGSGPTGPCRGLECNQTTCTMGSCTQMPCAAGTSTTVSGTVYDPAGLVPLYNATVYVPNDPLPPMPEGASCVTCAQTQLGSVTETRTDTTGRFVLPDVPVGTNVPLVIQIGKWRREITIPNVPRCVDTALVDPEQTSLPSKKTEGYLPRIALTTGGSDSLECLLLRMGVEASEFTSSDGDGSVHLYAGTETTTVFPTTTLDSGAALPPADALWSTVDALSAYDLVILSCEGDATENPKPQSARQALFDYTSIGGRLLASHWHHRWISQGPDPMPDVATFTDRENPETPATATINQAFPKGQALAQWLVNVGGSTTVGEVSVLEARDNVQAVNPMYATEWVRTLNTFIADSPATLNFTFNTPLTAAENSKCGRVAFTGLHVLDSTDTSAQDSPGNPFPSSCQQRSLTPQEKILEFMLFDLSSCVQSDSLPPGQ